MLIEILVTCYFDDQMMNEIGKSCRKHDDYKDKNKIFVAKPEKRYHRNYFGPPGRIILK
jgi:hypothetical protein